MLWGGESRKEGWELWEWGAIITRWLAFKQRAERGEEVRLVAIISRKKAKATRDTGVGLGCRSNKEAIVAGAAGVNGRGVGEVLVELGRGQIGSTLVFMPDEWGPLQGLGPLST